MNVVPVVRTIFLGRHKTLMTLLLVSGYGLKPQHCSLLDLINHYKDIFSDLDLTSKSLTCIGCLDTRLTLTITAYNEVNFTVSDSISLAYEGLPPSIAPYSFETKKTPYKGVLWYSSISEIRFNSTMYVYA